MHRVFLHCTDRGTSPLRVEGGPYHHLVNVLRCKAGDRFSGFTAGRHEYRYQILEVNGRQKWLLAERQEAVEQNPGPVGNIHLFPSLLKASAFTGMLRKVTEAGATSITPVIADRSVSRPAPGRQAEQKLGRWNAVVRDATEQCGRVDAPDIGQPVGLVKALAGSGTGGGRYYLDGAGETMVTRLLRQASPDIVLFVGPEGGFTEEEKKLFAGAGAEPVSLGPHTFRADTASIAACAVVTAIMHMRFGTHDS